MSGSWTVWGVGREPIAENVSYDEMKRIVDADESDELYGDNRKTGETYEP